jgi:predicted outer membrane repeat protein
LRVASCCSFASLALLLGTFAGAAFAATYRVPLQATLPTALTQAVSGDSVLISPGHYTCSSSVHSGVVVVGNGPAGSVTLDAQGTGPVLALADAGASTYFGNLVLTGGVGALVDGQRAGGGVYGIRSSPVLSRVHITGCSANIGGGAYFEQGAPSLRGCLVDHNSAEYGAGLALNRSVGRLDTCSVQFNAASAAGGGMVVINSSSAAIFLGDCTSNSSGGDGGGCYFLSSAGSLEALTFQSNTALGDGGAIFGGQGCALDCMQDVLWKNHAGRGGGAYLGCGAPAFAARVAHGARAHGAAVGSCGVYHLINNTLFDNSATTAGGGVAISDGAEVRLLSNIIAFASTGSGVSCLDLRSSLDLRCNDVWHNLPVNFETGCGATADPALGNLSVNPLFCDPLNGDFALCSNTTLTQTSQCGTNLIGAIGGQCPACRTPVRVLSWGSLKRLYLGGSSAGAASPSPR